MKHQKRLTAALAVAAALMVTAGIAYAAGVGAVNNGTDSTADGDYSTFGS